MKSALQRIEAIDIFRAFTMFLMVFVNDLNTVIGVPHWMEHAATREDMLGLSDVVFPAFLFVMGMSIPFAIKNRKSKGDSLLQILFHIGLRSLALLVMGVFQVNYESLDPVATGLSTPCFSLLMVSAFFLIWMDYPKRTDWKKYIFFGMQALGMGILAYLFSVYSGTEGSSFSTSWWGILGLIGWSYLVCALLFLLTKDRPARVAAAWVFLMLVAMLRSGGLLRQWGIGWLIPPGGATLQSITMAGVFASVLLKEYGSPEKFKAFLRVFAGIGIVLFLAGLVAHQFWIVSKNMSTPTWMFYCVSISFVTFALMYWIADIKHLGSWFLLIKPAGTATLTCYLIPYYLYAIFSITGFSLPEPWITGIPGLIKCILIAFLCIGITRLLLMFRIKLKL